MNQPQRQIMSIVGEAVEYGVAEERAAFVEKACAGDAGRRARVEALLRAYEAAGNFLQGDAPRNEPVATIDDPISERPGTMIGQYKLLEQIGEGGFGVVFMAEQMQPVRRKVALKVLKPGMDTRQVVARFEAERQALALMEHPNIARVFDGGQTTTGRPYFVMELVKGEPITDFCDRNQLSLRERLQLFLSVCDAVRHAHQKAIIHRDLKPSNILVTMHDAVAVVKVIDFGVAKALGQVLTDKTLFTGFAQMIGTPLYMSPEQAGQSGLDVDTRSDIYSLGVLLYELLTGTTPFDKELLRSASYDEIRRIIREEDPAKPSTRISTLGEAAVTVSANRRSDPKKLGQIMRGELDWMVMKALEKDRNRRYETASAFAEDVQRYLNDEPVEACPPSVGYRLRKFARRRKAALAAASAVVLAVVLGVIELAVSYVLVAREKQQVVSEKQQVVSEKERADRNLASAKKAVREYLAKTARDPRLKEADLLNLRKNLLATALPFYEEFVRQKADEPDLEAERGQTLYELAKLREELGEIGKARDDFDRARVVFADLAAVHAEVPKYREALAVSLYDLGRVLDALRQPAEAEAAYQEALALLEKLLAEVPDQPDYRRHLAAAYNSLGALFSTQGKHAEAGRAYRQAVAVNEKLVADFPSNPSYRESLAIVQSNLGNQMNEVGKTEDALVLYRKALTVKADLVKRYPGNREYRDSLAMSHNNLGARLDKLGRRGEAEAEYRESMSLWAQLAADFRSVPEYRHCLAMSYFNRGQLLKHQRQPVEAIAAYRQTGAILEVLVRDFPKTPEYREHLARNGNELGRLCLDNHQPAEAEAAFRPAIVAGEALVADHPQNMGYAIFLAGNYVNMGIAVSEKGQPEAALGWDSKAAAVLEPLCRRKPQPPNAQWFLRNAYYNRAETLMRLKRYREALPDWDRSIELTAERQRWQYRLGRLEALARLGEHVRATSEADPMAAANGATAGMLYDVACIYALSVAAAGADRERAEYYATRAVQLLRRAVSMGYKNVAHMKKDPDLASLRANEGFKKLLAELEAKGRP